MNRKIISCLSTIIIAISLICSYTLLSFAAGEDVSATETPTTAYLNVEYKIMGYDEDGNYIYAFYLDELNVLDVAGSDVYVEYEGCEKWLREPDVVFERPEYTSSNSRIQTIINNSLKYASFGSIPTAYKLGDKIYGDSNATAFNCSSFVKAIIEPEMQKVIKVYQLPADTKGMQASVGTYLYSKGYPNEYKISDVSIPVEYDEDTDSYIADPSNLIPGDLVLFDTNNDGKCNHVGMYLGNEDYIHCSYYYNIGTKDNPKYKYGGVRISKLNAKAKQIVGTIRVIPSTPKVANKTVYATTGFTLRGGMSTSAKAICKISKGAALNLQCTRIDGYWAYVKKGTSTAGYMSPKNFTTKGTANFTYSYATTKKYTGKYIKPTVTVKYNGTKLTKGKHYTVTYYNNKKRGKAKIKITGIQKNGCYGTIYKYFTIK